MHPKVFLFMNSITLMDNKLLTVYTGHTRSVVCAEGVNKSLDNLS